MGSRKSSIEFNVSLNKPTGKKRTVLCTILLFLTFLRNLLGMGDLVTEDLFYV